MVTIEKQVSCVKREIRMREWMYPKWVASKRMDQVKMDRELKEMKAVLETLTALTDQAKQYGFSVEGGKL